MCASCTNQRLECPNRLLVGICATGMGDGLRSWLASCVDGEMGSNSWEVKLLGMLLLMQFRCEISPILYTSVVLCTMHAMFLRRMQSHKSATRSFAQSHHSGHFPRRCLHMPSASCNSTTHILLVYFPLCSCELGSTVISLLHGNSRKCKLLPYSLQLLSGVTSAITNITLTESTV